MIAPDKNWHRPLTEVKAEFPFHVEFPDYMVAVVANQPRLTERLHQKFGGASWSDFSVSRSSRYFGFTTEEAALAFAAYSHGVLLFTRTGKVDG